MLCFANSRRNSICGRRLRSRGCSETTGCWMSSASRYKDNAETEGPTMTTQERREQLTQPHPRLVGQHAAHAMRPEPVSDRGTELQNLLFAPVLPEQFHNAPDVTYKRRGEVALMYAVLDDAITCFQNGSLATSRRAQRLAREAEAWFFAEDPAWLFSFVSICAVLGLDPDYIRVGLRRWRQRYPAPVTPQRQRRRAASRSGSRSRGNNSGTRVVTLSSLPSNLGRFKWNRNVRV